MVPSVDRPRFAAVLARPSAPAPAPPGVDPGRFAAALLEDVLGVVEELVHVRPALAVCPPELRHAVAGLAGPALPLLAVGEPAERSVLAGLGRLGAAEGVVVCPDAPDLPPLLLAKLFRGLGSAEVAVCPAEDGGLVAVGSRLPVPDWLPPVGFDTADALQVLASAARSRRALSVGPGWRRLRSSADVGRLDRGLSGWPATRALLITPG